MKIGGLQRFTLSDYPGCPAAVVFTQGCNFRCPFCHNGALLAPVNDARQISETEVLGFLEKRKQQLGGVVISGGEPTLQPDLAEFIGKIKEMGFAVKLDTNGSNPEVLEKLLKDGLVDYIAMDIKAPLAKYDTLCGVNTDTRSICRSIAIIAKTTNHHFRTTWVKPLLDENDISKAGELLPASSKYVIQPFHPAMALDPSLRKTQYENNL